MPVSSCWCKGTALLRWISTSSSPVPEPVLERLMELDLIRAVGRCQGEYTSTCGQRSLAMTMTEIQLPVLLQDGDPGYDEARTVWNSMVDRRPAFVARCSSTAEVAAAVRFARSRSLEIGVRCGGHNIAGLAVPDGGLMIDLTPMGGVRVDPERRLAWVQGGALLGELDRAAQEFGL